MKNTFAILTLLFGAALAGTGYGSPNAVPAGANASEADIAWARVNEPVDGVANSGEAQRKWGYGSENVLAWQEKSDRQYRDRGLAFYRSFPADPRRWTWLSRTITSRPPRYWKDPLQGGLAFKLNNRTDSEYAPEDLALVDQEAKLRWDNEYLVMRMEALRSPAVPADVKMKLRDYEITTQIFRVEREMEKSPGDLNLAFRSRERAIQGIACDALTLAEEYPDADLISPDFPLLGLINHHDDSGLRASVLGAMELSGNRHVRESAAALKAFWAERAAKPLELALPGLDGKGIDLNALHGKVVLVTFWWYGCGSCREEMVGFEAMYKKYQRFGFEIAGVCQLEKLTHGNEAISVTERKDDAEVLRAKGVTYPNGVFGPFRTSEERNQSPIARKFGYPDALFANLLLDQQGRLVAIGLPAHDSNWLEFEIRRLLGLPPLGTNAISGLFFQ